MVEIMYNGGLVASKFPKKELAHWDFTGAANYGTIKEYIEGGDSFVYTINKYEVIRPAGVLLNQFWGHETP